MIIRFMDTDDTTSALASEYFHILIWGAPPYLATFALSGWFLWHAELKGDNVDIHID